MEKDRPWTDVLDKFYWKNSQVMRSEDGFFHTLRGKNERSIRRKVRFMTDWIFFSSHLDFFFSQNQQDFFPLYLLQRFFLLFPQFRFQRNVIIIFYSECQSAPTLERKLALSRDGGEQCFVYYMYIHAWTHTHYYSIGVLYRTTLYMFEQARQPARRLLLLKRCPLFISDMFLTRSTLGLPRYIEVTHVRDRKRFHIPISDQVNYRWYQRRREAASV